MMISNYASACKLSITSMRCSSSALLEQQQQQQTSDNAQVPLSESAALSLLGAAHDTITVLAQVHCKWPESDVLRQVLQALHEQQQLPALLPSLAAAIAVTALKLMAANQAANSSSGSSSSGNRGSMDVHNSGHSTSCSYRHSHCLTNPGSNAVGMNSCMGHCDDSSAGSGGDGAAGSTASGRGVSSSSSSDGSSSGSSSSAGGITTVQPAAGGPAGLELAPSNLQLCDALGINRQTLLYVAACVISEMSDGATTDILHCLMHMHRGFLDYCAADCPALPQQ
jgi:hypothetical protein